MRPSPLPALTLSTPITIAKELNASKFPPKILKLGQFSFLKNNLLKSIRII
jgi:hypothetical protein